MARARRCLRVLLGLVPWVVLSSGYAQTTGTLRGLVTDQAGTPLAGALIAVSSETQAVAGRGSVTDQAGIFQILFLPPGGDYAVVISFPGYAAVRLTDLEVTTGGVATVRVALQPETSVRQRVEVRARPQVVSLEETTTQTRFDSEFIEALPLLGRNYQDLLSLAPGVSDPDGDGNPNIHGARDTDVITLVDGVSTTDPLTGKIGAQLNIESIQEIEVKTSGATAEFSRAQGGFANIITKSGGNEFQGTLKFFWRGSFLDGDGAGIDDPALHGGVGERGLRDLRFNDVLPFLSFEGPIARDRAWFYMAHEYVRTEEPVNALSQAFVTGVREFREFVKLTWQPAQNTRLALSLNYDPQKFLNQGLNSLIREESGFTTRQGGPILTLKATSVLNPLVALETSASSFDERPARVPTLNPDTNHNGILYEDRNQNGFFEASERDPGEDYDVDGRFDVFERDLNHNGIVDPEEDLDKDHRFTPTGIGGQPGGCEGRLREDQDCDGVLDFVNEDQIHNGRLDPGEESDVENSATGVTGGVYVQESYKPFPNLSIGVGLRFDRERIDSFGYAPFDPAAERASYDRLAVLAGAEKGKNDFQEGNNDGLMNMGILGDPLFFGGGRSIETNAGFLVGPLRNAALARMTRHHIETTLASDLLRSILPASARGANGEFDPKTLVAIGVRPQQEEPFALTNNNLAPRLSVSWDPWSNGRSKLFATWGRYYDRLFLSTVVGEEGPDLVNRYYALDGDGVTGAGLPDHQIGGIISKAPPSTTQVDRGLETPFSDELTFGLEREIAPELAVSLTYVNRRFRRQLQDIDINHTLRSEERR